MITEDYVSFETAKLLKEKGFKEITQGYINADKEVYMLPFQQGVYELSSKQYPYPTLQMAMKWLRDVHKKVINVEYIDFLEHGEVWSYSILDRNTFHEFTEKSESFTEHSYEEACEAAIKYCLENLI